MVYFVSFFESTQYRDAVFHGRFADEHLLKTSFESRIFFNVFTKLVQCRCTDEPKFAAREHRLDHVASVHGTFARARANNRMHFVDERDHLAIAVGDLFEHGFESLFELAAVLGSCDHRRNI